MNHRWGDLNDGAENSSAAAAFLGGCGEADLWLLPRGTLICRYEDYRSGCVSYWPASAIHRHITGGVFDHPNVPIKLEKGRFYRWFGAESLVAVHDAIGIARYLAVFAPYLFTDGERADLLGLTLTKHGETEGAEHGA
jgi:hypothetical protein